MKKVLGVLIAIGGIGLGAYVGFWLMFVGGIAQIIDGFNASPFNGTDIGVGALRVLFAGVGEIIAVVFIIGGIALASTGKWRTPRLLRRKKVTTVSLPGGWAPTGYPNQPFKSSYPPPGWVPPSTHPNGPYGGPPTSSSS